MKNQLYNQMQKRLELSKELLKITIDQMVELFQRDERVIVMQVNKY